MKKEILKKFYDYFSDGNYEGMKSLYSENVIFNDEIFKNLNYDYVTSMWEMLLKNKEKSKFRISYEILGEEDSAYVKWTAIYLFGPKKRKVKNVVTSNMKIENDKIVSQVDSFKFKKWAKQSIGIVGGLFGNKKWFIEKVQTGAYENLDKFVKSK